MWPKARLCLHGLRSIEICVLRGHGWDDATYLLRETGVWAAAYRTSSKPARPPQPGYGFRSARAYE
jgi:hypothetical protein